MKWKILFCGLLMAGMMSTEGSAQNYKRGDVDGSGAVSISDVVRLVSSLNDKNVVVKGLPDVDADGQQNAQDAVVLSDILLQHYNEAEHDYVDLGLPSGTLWATANVGAVAVTDAGCLLAWGEYAKKDDYLTSTYRDGTCSLSKSETNIIGTCCDAATILWGEDWQMPTREQQQELMNHCDWTWSEVNGLGGMQVTSRINGNSIFLPAVGYQHDTRQSLSGAYGFYWNGDHASGSSAECLSFGNSGLGIFRSYYACVNGRSVRAVRANK